MEATAEAKERPPTAAGLRTSKEEDKDDDSVDRMLEAAGVEADGADEGAENRRPVEGEGEGEGGSPMVGGPKATKAKGAAVGSHPGGRKSDAGKGVGKKRKTPPKSLKIDSFFGKTGVAPQLVQ